MTEYIVGIGMTRLGRHESLSLKDLVRQAVHGALSDAGCTRDAIDVAFFANTRQGALEGQHGIRGQAALRGMGFHSIPIFNTDNACASSSSALHLARNTLRAGAADVALVVGAEKMYYPHRRQQMFDAFLGSMDRDVGIEQLRGYIEAIDDAPWDPDVAFSRHSIFMEYYAARARRHMRAYGTTVDEIATVAVKNHANSRWNEFAQYREPFTLQQVLDDKAIVWPLTRTMCAPITDGAASLVVVSEDAIGRLDRSRAVKLLASAVATGSAAAGGLTPTEKAAERAYAEASLGPHDVSVFEVHDATAFAEIEAIEALGLVARGVGADWTREGRTAIDGSHPVNTTGGLVSKGHPIGATGAIQIHDLVKQVRGEAGRAQVRAARIGLAENGGGFYGANVAVASVTIVAAP